MNKKTLSILSILYYTGCSTKYQGNGENVMISNQVLQNTIDGLKGITRMELCVCDVDGKTLTTTFADSSQYEKSVASFAASAADSQSLMGCQFFKIFDENQLEYILIAQGSKNLVLLNEWQAVEYAHTAIIEGQIQPILIKCLSGYDPFQ